MNGKFVFYQPHVLGFLSIKDTLDQVNSWPANPLDYLDGMSFLLDRIRNVLAVEEAHERVGFTFSGLRQQESAYTRAASLVRSLIA